MATRPSPVGVLRYVPSSAYVLTISNICAAGGPLSPGRGVPGQGRAGHLRKGGRRSQIHGGGGDRPAPVFLDRVGDRRLPAPRVGEPVYFARITDQGACARALAILTGSVVAGKDTSLVLDGTRIDKLSIPWYVELVLGTIGVSVPEPYFITRGDYFFLSLDAQNLAAVVRAADTGANLAQSALFTSLMQGTPADATFLVWYDIGRVEPFFLKGAGLLSDVLHIYPSVLAAVRVTPADVKVSLAAARVTGGGVELPPGVPALAGGGRVGRSPGLPFCRDRRGVPGVAQRPLDSGPCRPGRGKDGGGAAGGGLRAHRGA